MKKFAALLLAMMMVVSILPIAAFAADCQHYNLVEDHTRKLVVKEPGCMTAGSYKPATKCGDCGTEFNRYFNTRYEIESLGHTMPATPDESQVVYEATCARGGKIAHIYNCTVCGKFLTKKYEYTDSLDHTMPAEPNSTEVVYEATCAHGGKIAHIYNCTGCGKLLTKRYELTDPTNQHVFTDVDNVEVVYEPTCCDVGQNVVTYGCTGCSATVNANEITLPTGGCPDENGNGVCDLWD